MEKNDRMPSIEVIDGFADEVDYRFKLPWTIYPSELSPTSKKKGRTIRHSSKRTPSKQHGNLLNIDHTGTLAAISARLATVIPAAETECARIHRKALATLVNRSVDIDNQERSSMPQSHNPQLDSIFTNTKEVMTSALHDSIIAEEWINLHLETNGAFLLPVSDKVSAMKIPIIDKLALASEAFVFRRGGDGGPLGRAGMDRGSLYQMGMSKELVDRLYRALYVYTNGFHNLVNEITSHCPSQFESHVSSNAWLTFLQLVEQCETGKYEIAMLKLKHAAQNAQNQLQDKFKQETFLLTSHLRSAQTALINETASGAEKTELITELIAKTTESTQKIAEQQGKVAAQAEQIRQLKHEVLINEKEGRKLKEYLDFARKECEVANTGRLNALSKQNEMDEEVQKLSKHLDRVESEKMSDAKRMRDTLVLNQALRAKTDQLKESINRLEVEKGNVLAEKQSLQEQMENAQVEKCRLQDLSAQIDQELAESRHKQSDTETYLQTIKQNFDMEVKNSQQEIIRMAAHIEEEKERAKALEMTCNLLIAEKLNPSMREQDKLQFERLLDQMAGLEAIVEANKLERKRDEEETQTLRFLIKAMDTELQDQKRVYLTGEQAFLHIERTCKQLQLQSQELERNYVKAKKNVASVKQRLKMNKAAAKEQITKLEVEVKITRAQLREKCFINKDNVVRIEQLQNSLLLSEKEATEFKVRIEEFTKQVVNLQTEKEKMKRNWDLATSLFESTFNQCILSLQNRLALLKLDEIPLDEAIREILQLVQETFGKELNLDNVIEHDDKFVTIELAEQEDVANEERAGLLKRAAACHREKYCPEGFDNDETSKKGSFSLAQLLCAEQTSTRRENIRISQFQKRLDHLVTKLQSAIALKAETGTNVVNQSKEILQLATTTKQQTCVIWQFECQKGMLQADLEMVTLKLTQARIEKQVLVSSLDQARIDQALCNKRARQVRVVLAKLRREFDMQVIAYEDAMSSMWRLDDHNLYMHSLRRNKDVQATVILENQFTQTLVQQKLVFERSRVPTQLIPTDDSGSSETLFQRISRATRELLPVVAYDMDLNFKGGKPKRSQNYQHDKHKGSRQLIRKQYLAQARERDSRRRLVASNNEHGILNLPPVNHKGISAFPLSQIICYENEFGTRQNVVVPSSQTSIFIGQPTRRSLSPRPPRQSSQVPRSLNITEGPLVNDLLCETQDEELVEFDENTLRQPTRRLKFRKPDQSSKTISTQPYDRKSGRVNMETLRTTGSCNTQLPGSNQNDRYEYNNLSFEEETCSDEGCGSSTKPSRLAAVVSMYNREKLSLQEATWRAEPKSFRQTVNYNHEDATVEANSATQNYFTQLFPAVLYPLLPNL